MQTDILLPCYNRCEYTRMTLGMLIRNTTWDHVRHLLVYDDMSDDGTTDFLQTALATVPASVVYYREQHGSPVEIMNAYLGRADADTQLVAKIDNDIVVPPDWLEQALAIMVLHPELELLGLAAGWTGTTDTSPPTYEPCSHIGGVGLMRVAAFRSRPAMNANGRFGFTAWQEKHDVVSGWAVPDIQAVQLDLVPAEPWATLKAEYVERGWNRDWPPYSQASAGWWEGWPTLEEMWP